MRRDFDIGISCPTHMAPYVIPQFRKDLAPTGLRVLEEEKPDQEVFAAVEWLIPTVIVVYIAKPYFETILREAAKDHYSYLKRAFAGVVCKAFGQHSDTRPSTVSQILSIYSETAEEQRVKFLLEEGLPLELYDRCFEAAHQLLLENHMNLPRDDLTSQLRAMQRQTPALKVLRFRKETQTWLVIDPIEEARRKKMSKEEDQEEKRRGSPGKLPENPGGDT